MGGRRAPRQDPRGRRPRPDRRSGRPAGARLRDAVVRLRPLRRPPSGPGTWAWSCSARGARGEADFVTIHLPKTPETAGSSARELSPRRSRASASSTRPAAGSSTRRRPPRRSAVGPGRGRRPRRVRDRAVHGLAAVRAADVVVTPHLGASTVEAQDKAGVTIAEQVVLALAGDFVPFAVNVAADRGVRDGAALPAARRAARAAASPASTTASPTASRSSTRAGLAGAGTADPHPGRAEGGVRRGNRGARLLRERPAARRGARPGGARGLDHRHSPTT